MEIKIKIPAEAKVLVKEEEKIEFNQDLFHTKAEKEIKINVCDQLKISPEKIFNYLKKFIDDAVKEGEIIAEKTTLIGKKKLKSPISGKIKAINHENGEIVIVAPLIEKTIQSYFQGKVKKIDKKEIIVQIFEKKSYPIKKTSGDFGGEVFYFHPNAPVDAEMVEKKIVIAESLTSIDQIKIETLGAAGIVTLKTLPNLSEISYCYLKNIPDFEEILKEKFSACTVIKDEDKIIFYD